MSLLDLFSKRQKRLRGETPDVFIYDNVPQQLRVQVVHIWTDAFGNPTKNRSPVPSIYKSIYNALCREYGQFYLWKNHGEDEVEGLVNYLLTEDDSEKVLDIIELSFRVILNLDGDTSYHIHAGPVMTANEAISELNARFLEHGVGYEFTAGELIRKDSELLHGNVVKPTLALLRDKQFEGANQEFLSAHEHYRHGRYKECLNDCLKAFESTLKIICAMKGWKSKPTDTAKTLLDISFQNGLVPAYLQSEFTSLRSTLESGVPTIRNKTSGHGQGTSTISVPQHLAGYVLHLTATSILFLAQSAGVN